MGAIGMPTGPYNACRFARTGRRRTPCSPTWFARPNANMPDCSTQPPSNWREPSKHIEEFRKHLLAKARSDFHISETIRLITAFTTKCRLNILAELQGAGTTLEGYLADRRESGSSHRTINADLTAVRSFCRWLLSKKRMHDDPTAGLSKLNEDEDPRRERRPLSDDEAQKLVETANASTLVFGNLPVRIAR